MTFNSLAKANWRDWSTDGVPSSGVHKPPKADLRAWGLDIESVVAKIVTPYHFGAKGDGITDDSAAVSNAIAYALANDRGLYVPAGNYLLNSLVSATLGTSQDFVVWGEGRKSRFLVNNTTGGFKFTCGARSHIEVSFLAIEPAKTGGSGSGWGLFIEGPYGSASDKVMAWVHHVNMVPQNQNTSEGWYDSAALKVQGCKRPKIERVIYTTGELVPATAKANALMNLSGSYQTFVSECQFKARAVYGFRQDQTGYGNEGFHILNCIFSRADYGLHYQDTARSPDIRIIDSHFNSMIENLHIDGLKFGEIRGNLFYQNLDEITYTYTQSGTTVSVTANQDHLFLNGDNFTVDSTTGGLAATAYTNLTKTGAATFTFTAGDSATRSGTLDIKTESTRRFSDIALLNADGIIISDNNYQVTKATTRRHVNADKASSIAASPVIEDITIKNDMPMAKSIVAAYYFGNGANNCQVSWRKPTAQGSYAGGMIEAHSGASGIDAAPADAELYRSATPISSDGGTKILMTYALPARWLSGDRGIAAEFWGVTANNANAKTVRFNFGTQIASYSLTTGVAGVWHARLTVLRSGASTQRWKLEFTDNDGSGQPKITEGTLTESESAAINVRATTNAATALNDLTQNGMVVKFI